MEQKSTGSRLQEKKDGGHRPRKNTNTRIWGSACLFIGFWMFCLGVLVGRGTAPVEFDIHALQKQLAELKQAALEKTRQYYQTDAKKAGGKTELEFYEALKRAQDPPRQPPATPATEAKTQPAEKQTTLQPPVETAMTADGGGEKQTAAVEAKGGTRVASTVKVRAEAFKKSRPAAKPVVKTEPFREAWTIQVAALKDAEEANRLVTQLLQKGYAAYKLTGEIPGKGLWHRVRVGRYRDREETTAVISRLAIDRYASIPVNTGNAGQ